MKIKFYNFISFIFIFSSPISAKQCGGGLESLCPMGNCGLCGSSFSRRCGSDIQLGGVSNILSSSNFDLMLRHRNDPRCPSNGFYSYTAFISAANSFDGFGTTGNLSIRKRELAAFLAQTSHETTGGWATAPDGPYAWGYCYVNETNQDANYCTTSPKWPCASGKKYYGRGPFQISFNFNYGPAGQAIGVDLINNPDLVATNPTISFKTALWFWMSQRGNNLSIHDIITGKWIPSNEDRSAGRLPGYGMITNIINGGNDECGNKQDSRVVDRIGFYKRYCDILDVGYGDNVDCDNQKPFL